MYASQVVDMRRQVDCVKFSLQQEQEKQRIVEKKTQELREMLSRELVESQRYVKLAANLHLSWIHLEKVCIHGVYTIFANTLLWASWWCCL